jgi:predicted NAD/FAD-binding protein
MPRDGTNKPERLRIGVIGSGVAGLGAAHFLSARHDVCVYEQDGRPGGHSNTLDVPVSGGSVAVDTGFIVYNERNYPTLNALFRLLGVHTQASDMSFSVSIDAGAYEYAGTGVGGLFVQRRNWLRARHWSMLRDILRFYREGHRVLLEPNAEHMSLGAYLEREGYGAAFVDAHLLPMAAAIWSTPAGDVRRHPVVAFVRFCQGHGLMRVTGRPQWRTVSGGSREYVRKLVAAVADLRLNARVTRVLRTGAGVIVEDDVGGSERFDRVLLATHADQALRVLADADPDERDILGSFRYTENEAVLHTDARLMPVRRRAWSSWNYVDQRPGPGADAQDDGDAPSVSYWMNRLQALQTETQIILTLNPRRQPALETVKARLRYHHPSYDAAAVCAQQRLHTLQGRRGSWLCGSYFGAGFHEDALVSGLRAAEEIGGISCPWLHAPRPVVPASLAAGGVQD